MLIKCDMCGKEIIPGNKNGLPNGVGFQLENGKTINACLECIEKVGEDHNYLEKFLNEWENKK